MLDTPTTHNMGLLDDIVKVAFRREKTRHELLDTIKSAKGEGHEYKDLQRSFYIGEIVGSLHPTAPKVTSSMSEEAGRILDLKNYTKKGGDECRTDVQQRLYNALRKKWQRVAFAAGLDTIDNRGSTGPQVANPEPKRTIRLRRYVPPVAKTEDEVIEFTLDLAGLVQKYVETNSKIIPPDLRPVFAGFLRGMAFATSYTPADKKKVA